jgi:hypothetical protein
MPYDALKAPDPEDRLDLDEQERIGQVIEYHWRHHLPMGESVKLHGVAHVVVENQFALGDATVVPATLNRLMRAGLDRHEAVHAIGSVFIGMSFDAVTKKDDRMKMAATSTRNTAAISPRCGDIKLEGQKPDGQA